MRLRVFTLVLLGFGAAAVWACSLNPQPLPPETPIDAGIDSSLAFGPEAGGGVDGSFDASPPPTGGDADASDASDASEDAGDASDASDDARDADTTTDGGNE